MQRLKAHRLVLLVGFAFLLLSLVLTMPLLSNERIVGEDYAGSVSLWITWFPSYAFQNNLDLVYSAQSLYPIKVNYLPVISLPTSILYYALDLPLNNLLAYNVLYPLYMALTGWGGFLFLRQHVNDIMLAIIGGGVLAFNPISFELATRGELALLGWFALLLWMLLWDRFLANLSFGRLVVVVLASYLVVLLSIQFWNLSLTLLIPYAVFGAYKLNTADRARVIDFLIIGGLILALLVLLFPASPLLWSTYGDQYAPIEVWQGALHLDTWYWFIFGVGGLTATVLSLMLPWEIIPDRRWWVLIAGLNLVCYALVDLAPLTLLGNLFRVPDNPSLTRPAIFLFPVILSASVLILRAINASLSEVYALRYTAYGGLGALVFLLSGWWGGLPTSPVLQYDFYQSLAEDQENYMIIDFPVGVDTISRRSLEEADEPADAYPTLFFDALAGRTLAYMPQHHKRVLGGLTTHLSQEDFAPYQESPLVRLLTFQSEASVLSLDTQARMLRREVVRWRVGYVVLRPAEVPPDFSDALRGWLHWIGSFCAAGSEGDLEIWRATWHPAGCPAYRVELGGAAGVLAADDGWYPREFWDVGLVRPSGADGALGSPIKLWVDRPATDYDLIIEASSPVLNQVVEVLANGEILGEFEPNDTWHEYRLVVPRLAIEEDGLLDLELLHSHNDNIDGRLLTAVYRTVSLEPIVP